MRIELSAQRAQFCFGGEFTDLLLAQVALAPLMHHAHRIDPPGQHEGHRFEQRDIV